MAAVTREGSKKLLARPAGVEGGQAGGRDVPALGRAERVVEQDAVGLGDVVHALLAPAEQVAQRSVDQAVAQTSDG